MKKKVWEMPLTWGKRYDDEDMAKLIRSRKQRAVLAVIHYWLSPGRKPGREASKCHCIVEGIPWLVKDYRTLAKEATEFLRRNEEHKAKALVSKAMKGDKWAKEQHDKLLHRWDHCPTYEAEMTVHRSTVGDAINQAMAIGIMFAVDGNHHEALGGGKFRYLQTYMTIDYVRLDELVDDSKNPDTERAKSGQSTAQLRTLNRPFPDTPPENPDTLDQQRFLQRLTEGYSVPSISSYLKERKEQVEKRKASLQALKEQNQNIRVSGNEPQAVNPPPATTPGYEMFFEGRWKGGDIPSRDKLPHIGSLDWGKLATRIKQHYAREVETYLDKLGLNFNPHAAH